MQPETFFVVPRGDDDGQAGVALRNRGAVLRRSDLPQAPAAPAHNDYSCLINSLGEHKAVLLGCLHALSMAAERDALTFDLALQVPGAAAQAQRDKCMTVAVASRSAALRLLQQPSPARRASTTEQELCAEFEALHHCIETLLTQESTIQTLPPVQLPGICCRTRPRPETVQNPDHRDLDDSLSGLVYAPHTSANRSLALWAEALVVHGLWLGVLSLTVLPFVLPHTVPSSLVAGTSLPECALFSALAFVAVGVLANLYLTAQRIRALKTPPVSTGNGGRTLSYNVALQPTVWWQRQVQGSFRRYVTVAELVRQWHSAQALRPARGMQRSGSEDSVSGPTIESELGDGPLYLRLDEPMPPQDSGPPSPRSLTPPLGPLTAAAEDHSSSSLYSSSGGFSVGSSSSSVAGAGGSVNGSRHRRNGSRNSAASSTFSTTEALLHSVDLAVLATREKASGSFSSVSSGCSAPNGAGSSCGSAAAAAAAATTAATAAASESDDEADELHAAEHLAGSESDEDPAPSPALRGQRGQRGAQRGGVQSGVHLLTPLHL